MSQNRASAYAKQSPRPAPARPAPGGPAQPPARAPRGAAARTSTGPNASTRTRTGAGAGAGAGTRTGTGRGKGAEGVGPLTGLGVTIVLLAGCVIGALLDLLLVGGPAWALISLYIAACAYTATRVRGADWFTALVAPPIAFGIALILLAKLMPDSFGSGLLGVAATTFELLAAKAKALYFGTALSAVILLARRVRKPRA